MASVRGRAYGITLVTAANVLWSTAGLFVRMLDLDVWTMVVWRSFFATLALLLLIALQNGRRWSRVSIAIGWPGLAAALASAVSQFSFIAALKLTTVANVLIIFATIPFIAAGAAFLWFGEKVRRRVLLASIIAFLGIVVMAGSGTRLQDLEGIAFAFLTTSSFAAVLVMVRRYPSIAMTPISALASALCAVAGWPLMSGDLPNLSQLAILALFGITTNAVSYLLYLTGGRYIPSSEAGLIALLDIVLGPLWVWLAYAEQPSRTALVGGGLALASVLWYLLGERRKISGSSKS